jgi:hypothetical protein
MIAFVAAGTAQSPRLQARNIENHRYVPIHRAMVFLAPLAPLAPLAALAARWCPYNMQNISSQQGKFEPYMLQFFWCSESLLVLQAKTSHPGKFRYRPFVITKTIPVDL